MSDKPDPFESRITRIQYHGVDVTITLYCHPRGWRWDASTSTAGCIGYGGVLSALTREEATLDAFEVLRSWYLENVGPLDARRSSAL